MTITSIKLVVPTDDSYWTNDADNLPSVPNAVANFASAAEAYIRREYPDADIEVCTADAPRCEVEVDGEPDEVAGAELEFEVRDAVDWSDIRLWDTDPDEFDAEAHVKA